MTLANSLRTGPDERGHFGQFGGRYVAETLMPLILDLERHYEAAKVDPAYSDGLYHGASRGHAQPRYAQKIGMPRGYGYGASMGAWILDYISNWAGEWSDLLHSKMTYRSPALTGDLTYLDGEVVEIISGKQSQPSRDWLIEREGCPAIHVVRVSAKGVQS